MTPRSSREILLGLSLWLTLGFFGPSHLHGDEYSRDFVQATRKFFSKLPAVRLQGEQAFGRLGERVLPQIRKWIEDAGVRLARMQALLAELEGESIDTTDRGVRGFFRSQLEQGWKFLRDGDHDRARRVAEALETLDGGSSAVFDYRRLLRAAEKRMLRSEILEPVVEFRDLVYETGESPAILFRLTNLQAKQLVIQTDRGKMGTLELTLVRSFVDGQKQREVRTIPVRALDDVERIVLPARRSYEREIAVDLEDQRSARDMVIRLTAVGRFRPSQWGMGNYNVNHTLELPATECWVVPQGEKELADDLIRKIKRSILLNDTRKFFTAGQLAVWAATEDPEMNDRFLRLIIGSLDDLNGLGFTLADRFLKQAGGVSAKKQTDRGFWREWLDKRGPRPRTLRGRSRFPRPPARIPGREN